MSKPKHIVVAGAGIIGASIAWHLAAQGARVSVIDKASAAAEASGRSFGWLNTSQGKGPYRYHLLSRLGVQAWRDVATKLPLAVSWGGALAWAQRPLEVAREMQNSALQQAWGSPVRQLGRAEMMQLEPEVAFQGAEQASFAELDGWVDAAAATQVLLAAAQSAGAELHCPCELTAAICTNNRLTRVATSRGNIDATHLVVACGGNAKLMQQTAAIAVPQQPTAGVVVTTTPLPPLISRVLATNGTHVLQRSDGCVVMGEGLPLPTAASETIEEAQTADAAQRIVAAVSEFLPVVADATLASTTLGRRPMPRDGYPAIGRSPRRAGVYLAVTHSGVTLAIILGRLIALEILHDLRIELLAGYRPERF